MFCKLLAAAAVVAAAAAARERGGGGGDVTIGRSCFTAGLDIPGEHHTNWTQNSHFK